MKSQFHVIILHHSDVIMSTMASQITRRLSLNRLFRRKSRKTYELHVTGLCARNSPVTGEFPVRRASNAENASIWWRHHGEWFVSYQPPSRKSVTISCHHCRSYSYRIIHREVTVSCHHCRSDSYYIIHQVTISCHYSRNDSHHIIHHEVTVSCHQCRSDSYHTIYHEVTVSCHHCRSDPYHIIHHEVTFPCHHSWSDSLISSIVKTQFHVITVGVIRIISFVQQLI